MKKINVFILVSILFITFFVSIPIKAGPVQESLTSPDSQIIDMIQQVNESLLYYYNTHLTAFGPRPTGSENCTNASQYIYDEFYSMGLSVEFRNWTFNKLAGRNVVATIQGTDILSDAIFIICAHYDTVGISPGANDDGSGVAAILATAKILSQYTFNYTICFVAFSGEEVKRYGSFVYARDASHRGDNIVGVINLDEIGYSHTIEGGQTFCFLYPERSKWIADFATTVSLLYYNQTNISVESYPNVISSDHQSFIEYGYDAIMGEQYDYDEYYVENILHTQNDTSDKINWIYLTKVTKLLCAVVAELASTPIELQVIITKPYQDYLYFFNHPILSLCFWKNMWHGLRGTTFILGTAKINVSVIPNNDIVDVVFCVDGNIFNWAYDNAPNYEYKIQRMFNYPLFGRHILEVYVYTPSGKIASDEMNIIIFQPNQL